MGDDVRAVAGRQKCAQAAGVVDVAVRVSGGMYWGSAPRAHGAMHLLAQAMQTRIDKQESHVCFERVGVGELRVHEHAGRDLFGRRREDWCGIAGITRDDWVS